MTIDEIKNYVLKYSNKPAYGYNGMTIGDGVYKPMKQVIQYLQDYNFTVYVVSGTDRLIVRPLAVEKLGIPERQVIGSDETLVAKNQNNTEGSKYQYTYEDDIVAGGDVISKNLKMNKVINIVREIGVPPVLAFGNSPGDFSMARYTLSNNQYKSAAFMVCCDDPERENCDIEKTNKLVEESRENGFITISMKKDWYTIYGEEVTKKHHSTTIPRRVIHFINEYTKNNRKRKNDDTLNKIKNY
ncbi:hypothetical protein PIROE2DRAFT_12136 [Piromyces sp. E2]|nr:hypothetical protein PIROE2DRAFT_12136 [Piromyces sp. E2]|eukprot:OUM61779.1 hypothetical protein PIROE2DRAFT_12136 [Piromyces sp. E2]